MFTYALGNGAELRLLEPRHAEELFALVDSNREHLKPWMPWVDDTKSADDSREFIKQQLRQFGETNGFVAGIQYDGRLAGVIGLHVKPRDRAAEIGYWLGEEFEGKGLVTEACRVLVDYGFRELGLNRIQIRTATDNARSRAVVERLGFHHEGTLRQVAWLNGQPIDLDVQSLLREEWE